MRVGTARTFPAGGAVESEPENNGWSMVMNVLILGGSGFIGTHLTRRLARDGHQVTVATRYAPNARHLQIVPQVRVYQLDPHNPDQLASAVQGHDAAVNLVGILNQSGFGDRGFQRVHV